MASKNRLAQLKNQILASALLIILICTFALPVQAYAKAALSPLPALNSFIETVKNGKTSELRGVYVSNVMALSIIQQPAGSPGYVSKTELVATQFRTAAQLGNIGLLAHNTHAGSFFSNIKTGDLIVLVYGDGHTQNFMVNSIQRFQAMDPLNQYSQFKELDTTNSSLLSAEKLFNKMYRGDYHLTLQTCIEKDGNTSWGRLFIYASPVKL